MGMNQYDPEDEEEYGDHTEEGSSGPTIGGQFPVPTWGDVKKDDPGPQLTEEQMARVLCLKQASLIISGGGSGLGQAFSGDRALPPARQLWELILLAQYIDTGEVDHGDDDDSEED